MTGKQSNKIRTMGVTFMIKLAQNVNYTINLFKTRDLHQGFTTMNIILLISQKYMPQTILRLFSLNCLETLAP